MEVNNIYIASLLAKYQQGIISLTELEVLQEVLSQDQLEEICAQYRHERAANEELLYYFESRKLEAWKKLQQPSHHKIVNLNDNWKKAIKIAATILFISGLSLWVFNTKKQPVFYNEVIPDNIYGQKNDVSPGRNQTLIKMTDGKEINVRQDLLEITSDSVIAGRDRSFAASLSEVKTIRTPKAGNIEILLPDRSRVWLNASSELSLDPKFDKTNRIVYLKGEGYFQVAHNEKKRFQVVSDRDTVSVFGTSFNINCYAGKFQTTLVEGKVAMDDSQGNHLELSPGYQGTRRKGVLLSREVETLKYTSWKDGYFYFNHDNLQYVLSKLEQWYDIEIYPETEIKTIFISGTIGKNASLAEAVATLSDVSKLKFKIRNRALTISK